MYRLDSLEKLIGELKKLPGIGPKSAQRMAYYILGRKPKEVHDLLQAIVEAKRKIGFCTICGALTENDPCPICDDEQRDRTTVCVVEEFRDVMSIEATREYKGLYHVLNGAISPLDGIGPGDIRLRELLERLKPGTIQEIIIATNPNVEGEATAMYLARLLQAMKVKVTKVASGLPVGGDLEYADEMTLVRALEGRREMKQ